MGKGKEGDGKGDGRKGTGGRKGEGREGRGRTTCIPHFLRPCITELHIDYIRN